MKRSNIKANNAFFTTSIEAKDGITTGISAADRAHTISLLTKDHINKDDFITPGHVFPLIINKDGLSGRKGHTEGGATITKLAGFKPITIICEVLDKDGNSASKQYLGDFIKNYNLKLTSIKILQDYLNNNEIKVIF
jgi:3,4-dihydroxy-2-butanone 4-phosphate synthase